MVDTKLNRKALKETYEVIVRLSNEDYKKIPQKIVDGIKNNMDTDYEVEYENLEEAMMPETRLILATIYTKYLASIEEKNIIKQMIEAEKNERYYKNKKVNEIQSNVENLAAESLSLTQVPVKLSFFDKIINRIKNIFNRG